MNNKQIIERMANLWYRELVSNGVIEDYLEFEETLEAEFPELKFTYNVGTKQILLLTEVD
jgi:actin-related protein